MTTLTRLGSIVLALLAVPCRAAEPAAPPEAVVQTGHPAPPNHLAPSSDGSRVLTSDSTSGGTAIWDAATGRRLMSFARLSGAALSGDGKRLVANTPGKLLPDGTFEHRLIAVDLDTRRTRELSADGTAWHTVASRDGRRVAFLSGPSGGGKKVLIWEPEASAKRELASGVTYHELAISPDGKRVAVRAKIKGPVSILETDTGKEVARVEVPESCWNLVLGGGRLAAMTIPAKGRYELRVWNAETGAAHSSIELSESIQSLDVSDDGTFFFGKEYGGTVRIWRLGETLKEIGRYPSPDRSPARMTHDGSQFVVATADGKMVRYSTATGKKAGEWTVSDGGVAAAHFAGDDRVVLVAPTGAVVVLALRGGTGAVLTRPETTLPADPYNFRLPRLLNGGTAVSRDAKVLAVVGDEGVQVRGVTAAAEPTVVGPATRSDEHGVRLELSANGKRLLAARNRSHQLWDVENNVAVRTLPKGVSHSALAASAKFVAATAYSGSEVSVYDTSTGEVAARVSLDHPVSALAFSPDEKLLLVGAGLPSSGKKGEGAAKAGAAATLVDLATGKALRTYGTAGGGYTARVAFSGDGKTAVTSGGRAHRFWDVASGKLLREVSSEVFTGGTVSMTADGRFALVADGASAALWDVSSGKLVWRAYLTGDGTDWAVIAPDGRYDGSAKGRERVLFRGPQGELVADASRYARGVLETLAEGTVAAKRGTAPVVRFVTPKRGGEVGAAAQTVVVEATDTGDSVADITLTLNGKPVAPVGAVEAIGGTRRRTFAVSLADGTNFLEAGAKSAGGTSSEPEQLSLRVGKAGSGGTLYLLSVGVSEYADERMDLRYAAADAAAVAKLFRDRGKRGPFANVVVRELTNKNATSTNIKEALEGFAREAKPGDTLIAHLSGHGVTLGQRYYFLPHEFRRGDGEKDDDAVRRHGLPMDVLGPQLGKVKARNRVLILDTCGSGGVATNVKGNLGVQKDFDALHEKESVFVIAAAPTDGIAQESKELGHGVLTYALLAGLGGVSHGPLKDTRVRAEDTVGVIEWFNFAGAHFPKLMKGVTNRDQRAIVVLSGTSFPVLKAGDR